MKKKLLLFLSILCLILTCGFVLSACGGSSDADNGGGNNDGNTPYTLNFMLDENTVYHTEKLYSNNSYVNLPKNPTKDGFIFTHWNYTYEEWGETLTTSLNPDTLYYRPLVDFNINVFANWIEDDGKSLIKTNDLVLGENTLTHETSLDEYYSGNIYTKNKAPNSFEFVDLSQVFVISEGAWIILVKNNEEFTDLTNVPLNVGLNDFMVYVYKDGDQTPNQYRYSINRASIIKVHFYNQNTKLAEIDVEEDTPFTVPTEINVSKSGYKHLGWTTQAGSKTLVDVNQGINGAYHEDGMHLYAVFSNGNENLDAYSTLLEDGTLEIFENVDFTLEQKNITFPSFLYTHEVSILSGNLCNRAFIESVTIEEGVTSIEEFVFGDCPKLRTVNLPSSLKLISNSCFINDVSLESITIPNAVTKIGQEAFYGCTNLKSVNLPKNSTEIGDSAFKDCINLATVNLSNLSGSLGDYAFSNTAIKQIIDCANLKSIGAYCFAECKQLEKVELNKNLPEPGNNAFERCTSLKSVVLPNCIPLEYGLLYGCSALQSLTTYTTQDLYYRRSNTDGYPIIPDTLTKFTFLGETFEHNFDGDYRNSNIQEVVIGKDVKLVSCSFEYLPSLNKLSFEEGCQIEKFTYFLNISRCNEVPSFPTSLTEIAQTVTFSDNITNLDLSYLVNLKRLGGITANGLTTVDLSNLNVEYLGKLTVVNATSVILPESLVVFGGLATSKVESLEIPSSVTTISSGAFSGYKNLTTGRALKTVTFKEDSKLTTIESYAFYDSGLKHIDLPDTVEYIGDYAFSGEYGGCQLCNNSDSQFVLPSSLKYIGAHAFDKAYMCFNSSYNEEYKRHAYLDLEIPESVEFIGKDAFLEVSGVGKIIQYKLYTYEEMVNGETITRYSLHEGDDGAKFVGLTELPENAFYNKLIWRLDLSECTFTSIGKHAFRGTQFYNMQYIKFPSTLTTIDDEAFINTFPTTEKKQYYFSPSSIFYLPETITTYGKDILLNSAYTTLKLPTVTKELTTTNNGFCGNSKINTLLCYNTTNIALSLPKQITVLDFSECSFTEKDVNITYVIRSLTNLASLTLPETYVLSETNLDLSKHTLLQGFSIGGCKKFATSVINGTGVVLYSKNLTNLNRIQITNMETLDETLMTSLATMLENIGITAYNKFQLNIYYTTSIYVIDNVNYITKWSRDEYTSKITVLNSDKESTFKSNIDFF